jgi:hypothetical protein
MNQPLLIIKLVIRSLMRSSKHLLSLHIHEIIRPLREAHQALTALHHGCVLQTSIVLMVVLRLQVGPCLVLKVRAKYFWTIRREDLGRMSCIYRVCLELRWIGLLCFQLILIHGY